MDRIEIEQDPDGSTWVVARINGRVIRLEVADEAEARQVVQETTAKLTETLSLKASIKCGEATIYTQLKREDHV